jgi:hypothetical protein
MNIRKEAPWSYIQLFETGRDRKKFIQTPKRTRGSIIISELSTSQNFGRAIFTARVAGCNGSSPSSLPPRAWRS